ncbi:MAG: kelch repeat-containing protein [bacterium]|nr:kelch repeat-containing protein [bacterium]
MSKKLISLGVLLSIMLICGSSEAGRWNRTGDRVKWSMGYSNAVLTDGKVLLIGGMGDSAACQTFDPATGTWSRDTMPIMDHHTGALLLPNGKVLYATTSGSGSGGRFYLYNPVNKSWTLSAGTSIACKRKYTYLTLLKDGRVLLMYDGFNCYFYDCNGDAFTATGGTNRVSSYGAGIETLLPNGDVLLTISNMQGNTAEIFNPTAGTWSYTDTCKTRGRSGFVGVLLPPPWSKVLIAGGAYIDSMSYGVTTQCELFDPVMHTWANTGSMTYGPRYVPTMALLPSGKVLITGSDPDQYGSYAASRKCELYDPAAGTWSITDSVIAPIDTASHAAAFILPTGKLMFPGWGTGVTILNAVHPKAAIIYDPTDGIWTSKPSLNTDRAFHTVTPLPIIHTAICSTNVLIVGGENSSGALKSCELYNYILQTVIPTGDLINARTHHTAQLMSSGKVLVTGGKNTVAIKSCELFDVITTSWTATGDLNTERFDHTATLLPDGRVLVTGGENTGFLNSCEIYNGGAWTNAAAMSTQRTNHSAILLKNGNVIVIGGRNGSGALNSCELWNGTSWATTGSLNTGRYSHTSVLLQSGKVLVIGGTSDGSTGLASCEIYDPGTGTWTQEGSLNQARYWHNSTLLYSGIILTSGGKDGANYLSSCEVWDPADMLDTLTNRHGWKADTSASITPARACHSSVLIPSAHPYVLAIGGTNGSFLNSMVQYDVGLGYASDWQSTITNYPSVTRITSSMNIAGTLFRGVSEADGGNYSHITSNDHPIMSFVRVGGGNFQGNGGGDILQMPLSSSWSETNTTVQPTADSAYYRLWAIANGIPTKWYVNCAGAEEINKNYKSIGIKIFPNPVLSKAVFLLPETQSHKSISIYDLSGSLIKNIRISDLQSTSHKVMWDGRDNNGEKVKPGVYFYKTGYGNQVGKFVMLK